MDVITVGAWMLREADERSLLQFGHGCSGKRMKSEWMLLLFGHAACTANTDVLGMSSRGDSANADGFST